MYYGSFLIKYAEIAIKGNNRKYFEDALVHQINYALKKADGTFKVRKQQGRIFVDADGEYDYDEVTERLSKVFGIVNICPVALFEDEGVEKLGRDVVGIEISSEYCEMSKERLSGCQVSRNSQSQQLSLL